MRAKEIDRLVSIIMKVPVAMIRAKGKKRETNDWCLISSRKESEARYMAMHLRNKYLGQSFNSLAKEWGYANHSVVMSGIKNVRNHIETEKDLKITADLLERMVELRLEKILRNKKRYNDNLMLKHNGIEVKNEIVSISENKFNGLKNSCVRKLNGSS